MWVPVCFLPDFSESLRGRFLSPHIPFGSANIDANFLRNFKTIKYFHIIYIALHAGLAERMVSGANNAWLREQMRRV